MTDDLLSLTYWLVSDGCKHVPIESTDVYWKRVFNILERSLEVVLINARHVKSQLRPLENVNEVKRDPFAG